MTRRAARTPDDRTSDDRTPDDRVPDGETPDLAPDELADLPAPPPAAPRDARPSWTVVALALSAAVVGSAFGLYSLLFGGGGEDLERDRASALEAARERTVVITSYDHRRLDADFAAVLERAVGPFEDDYAKTTEMLEPTFTSQQAVATGTVVAAGLESADADSAVAVVAVDQVITTKGAAPRTERNRLRMTLVRPDGTWLVERVERL